MRALSAWFRSGNQGSAQKKMWLSNPRGVSMLEQVISLSLKYFLLILPDELLQKDAYL